MTWTWLSNSGFSAYCPPQETIFKAKKQNGKLVFEPARSDSEKRAFIGVRSCELHAIAVQDRVFIGGEHVDSGYASRREELLLVVVNCSRSAATCFCTSVNTGPKARDNFDIALTEICNDNEHYFVLEIGTERGAMVVEGLDLQDADCGQIEAAAAVSKKASKQQRSLNTYNLKQRIYDNIENKAYFADVADRCLNCANCTMVCPNCFCSTVEDVTDLAGESAQRMRYWDSCFLMLAIRILSVVVCGKVVIHVIGNG